MQLILDCETTVEINKKMATIDESSVIDHGDIQHLNADVTNGNKENIQLKENIIKMQDNSLISSEKEDINMEIAIVSSNNDKDNETEELNYVKSDPNEDNTPNNDNHIPCEQNYAKDQNFKKVDCEESVNKEKHNDSLNESESCNKYEGEVNNDKNNSSCTFIVNDNSNEIEHSIADKKEILNIDNDVESNNALTAYDTIKCEDASINTDKELKNEEHHMNDDSIKLINENENLVSVKEHVSASDEETKENEINTPASEKNDKNEKKNPDTLTTELIQKESSKIKPSEKDTSTVSHDFNTNTLDIKNNTMECDDEINDISERASSNLQESNILEPIGQESTLRESENSQSMDEGVTVQEFIDYEKVSSTVQESNILGPLEQESTLQKFEAAQLINEEVTERVSSTKQEAENVEAMEEEITLQGSEAPQLMNEHVSVKESPVEEFNIEESAIQETSECQDGTLKKSAVQKMTVEELTLPESSIGELAFEESDTQESTERASNVHESLFSGLKVDEVIVQKSPVHHYTDNTTVEETSTQKSMKAIENDVVPEIKTVVQDESLRESVEGFKPKEITESESTVAKSSIEGSVNQESDMEKAVVQDFTPQEITFKDIPIQETAVQEATLQTSPVLEAFVQQSSDTKSSTQNIPEQEVTLTESNVQSLEDKSDITEIIESNENKRKREEDTLEVPKKLCKLSNTLDIFSEDEDDDKKVEPKDTAPKPKAKQCIDIEDDDDIMLIDEEISNKNNETKITECVDSITTLKEDICNTLTNESEINTQKIENETVIQSPPKDECTNAEAVVNSEALDEEAKRIPTDIKPLLEASFLKSHKKNLADMSRDELEEFCVLKIVESIVDRSCLSEIKSKLKTMAQNIDEYKRKAQMLTRQNRDLQVVLKSVQEDQKKQSGTAVIPLKITRSVGVQVILNLDKSGIRRKPPASLTGNNNSNNKSPRAQASQSPKANKQTEKPGSNQIPVPRLIPANNPAAKAANVALQNGASSVSNKTPNTPLNLPKPSPPKSTEKRPHNKMQSVTVDLTDDEPPPKQIPRSSPAPPVRLVSPQNLLAPQRQPFNQSINSPRKVYIPIGGPQNQGIRPGQTIMLKTVPAAPRQRYPAQHLTRMPQNPIRMQRLQSRHPAPLPDATKQYQPPNWKSLPPAPDLKLSKVENGIVISWKIDGYQEDAYEEIASYQLYAYQENSLPPSTTLWKKIGDVKALPLPMACTLTQFMAGFKYYFAVRAVDIRSRVGPFSLPGSILLLNKM